MKSKKNAIGKNASNQKQSQNREPPYSKMYVFSFNTKLLPVIRRAKAIGKKRIPQKIGHIIE
jgi:hypothetical protein